MKASFFHFLSTIVFLCPMVFGQRPLMSAADINTSATGLHRSPQEAEILRKIYNIADTAQLTRGAVIIRKDFSRVTSMFTKPTNDENAVYQQFLKQRDTGIFTFLNPKSCARPTANQKN